VVFTVPKRLRPYCLYRRALLGDPARVAARIVTAGGFRPDGTFVRRPGWPAYDSAAPSEAFRRAVLRLFVRRGRPSFRAAPEGPTAGTAAVNSLELLSPGQVMTRYYGWYTSRTRGTRARLAHLASDGRRLTADGISVEAPVAIAHPVNWSLRAATTARSCCGASTRSIPSRARGVAR
jgi:hypothetical protein